MPSGSGYDDLGARFNEYAPATLEELAARCGVSLRTMQSWRKQGCPVMVDGVFSVESVKAWRRRKPSLSDPRGRDRDGSLKRAASKAFADYLRGRRRP